MARILISNVDTHCMLADPRELTEEFCVASANYASRMAWFAEPGDIVVLPRRASPEYEAYVARTMGYQPGAVTYVTPDWSNGHFRPIGSHELLHMGLAERITGLIGGSRQWSVQAYCHERGIQQFAERLGLDGNTKPFVTQGGVELLNDKRIFRSLAAGRGVAIAQGAVCSTEWEMEACVRSLIDVTGALIIKQDRHSAGHGNLIISRKEAAGAQGALEVLLAADETQLRDQSRIVWARLAYAEQTPLIVEVYYPVSAAVTAEFRVNASANGVTFLNCGEIRQAPVLSGLIMPCVLPPYKLAGFIAGATELARLCCDMGYEGLVNVDGIVTIAGDVIINEINGRIGGCSHIHHILQAVAGPDYGDKLVVMSHSKKVAMPSKQAFGILSEHGLAFDAKSARGIIITGEDTAASGHLDYLSIAPSREEAASLEMAFESILGRDEAPESQSGIEHLARILSHLPPMRNGEARERASLRETATSPDRR
jgi:hypothetical protein